MKTKRVWENYIKTVFLAWMMDTMNSQYIPSDLSIYRIKYQTRGLNSNHFSRFSDNKLLDCIKLWNLQLFENDTVYYICFGTSTKRHRLGEKAGNTRGSFSVRLFALLGAKNAHIRKSWRKIAFGSAQNATFW